MSNQYYTNTNGAYPGSGSAPVLPAYSPAPEGSVIMQAPIIQPFQNNNNNNNNNKIANNGCTLKILIVTTILSIIIAIVAIAISIVARKEAVNASNETADARMEMIKAVRALSNAMNEMNKPAVNTNTAVYAQAVYKQSGGTHGEVSTAGVWFSEDSIAAPVKVPSDGIYMISTTCRAYLGTPLSYWICRLIRNNDSTNALSVTYGGVAIPNGGGNGDNSVSGFWIGQLSAGDVIRQQYMINGPATTYNIYGRNDGGVGYSSIQIVRIGA